MQNNPEQIKHRIDPDSVGGMTSGELYEALAREYPEYSKDTSLAYFEGIVATAAFLGIDADQLGKIVTVWGRYDERVFVAVCYSSAHSKQEEFEGRLVTTQTMQ